MSQNPPTYVVYLDTDGLPLDLSSPVRTNDVMYYDSGIWFDRESDRLFVPYDRVDVIREVEGSEADEELDESPTEATDGPPEGPVE